MRTALIIPISIALLATACGGVPTADAQTAEVTAQESTKFETFEPDVDAGESAMPEPLDFSQDVVETTSTTVEETTTTTAAPTTTNPKPKLTAVFDFVVDGTELYLAGVVKGCQPASNLSVNYVKDLFGNEGGEKLDCTLGRVEIYHHMGTFDAVAGDQRDINIVNANGKVLYTTKLTADPTAPDPNPVPKDSGTGKRIVYDRRGISNNIFDVYLVDENNKKVHAYKVRGRKDSPSGTFKVYHRSRAAFSGPYYDETGNYNGDHKWDLPNMVRYISPSDPVQGKKKDDPTTPDVDESLEGNLAIGFHAIPCSPKDPTNCLEGPENTNDTSPSGGCSRQSLFDSEILWKFVDDDGWDSNGFTSNGTPVVVLG